MIFALLICFIQTVKICYCFFICQYVYPFGKVMHSFDGGVLFLLKATHSDVPPKRAHRIVVVGRIVVQSTVGVDIADVGSYST